MRDVFGSTSYVNAVTDDYGSRSLNPRWPLTTRG
jgi:hypothetical protein